MTARQPLGRVAQADRAATTSTAAARVRVLPCLFSAVSAVACGGATAAEPPSAAPVGPAPCCLDERWELPPDDVGATPPPRVAPEGATEAFGPDPGR